MIHPITSLLCFSSDIRDLRRISEIIQENSDEWTDAAEESLGNAHSETIYYLQKDNIYNFLTEPPF